MSWTPGTPIPSVGKGNPKATFKFTYHYTAVDEFGRTWKVKSKHKGTYVENAIPTEEAFQPPQKLVLIDETNNIFKRVNVRY